MANDLSSSPFIMILAVVITMFVLYLGIADTSQAREFEKQVSEESLAAGLYYSTQALPCLSKDANALDETKRFVLDRGMLDFEVADAGRISCAQYREIKYWLGVYDLDRKDADGKEGHWTFKNHQSLEEDKFTPQYGQIVAVSDKGKIHRAFVGVYVELPDASGKLPLWMFCNTTAPSEPADFNSILNENPPGDKYGINDAYKYPTNNCGSGNCIKGPGQALPACQPAGYTYSKDDGEPCKLKYECKSFSCKSGACESVRKTKLIAGQPCNSNAECITNICAYDKRCREDIAGGINITKFKFEMI